jgi:hypothetical protein
LREADERRTDIMMLADDVRRVRSGAAVGPLPMDCPYCLELLQDAPRGWVCRGCRSTMGAELGADPIEEGLR